MAEFEANAEMDVELPSGSGRRLRQQLEEAVSPITIQGQVEQHGGGAPSQRLSNGSSSGREQQRDRREHRWARERTNHLEDLVEAVRDLDPDGGGGLISGVGGGLTGAGLAGGAGGLAAGGAAGGILGRAGGLLGRGAGVLGLATLADEGGGRVAEWLHEDVAGGRDIRDLLPGIDSDETIAEQIDTSAISDALAPDWWPDIRQLEIDTPDWVPDLTGLEFETPDWVPDLTGLEFETPDWVPDLTGLEFETPDWVPDLTGLEFERPDWLSDLLDFELERPSWLDELTDGLDSRSDGVDPEIATEPDEWRTTPTYDPAADSPYLESGDPDPVEPFDDGESLTAEDWEETEAFIDQVMDDDTPMPDSTSTTDQPPTPDSDSGGTTVETSTTVDQDISVSPTYDVDADFADIERELERTYSDLEGELARVEGDLDQLRRQITR